ncbi:ATP-binding protein [Solirubrobacter ginsenosidimutans]|uniref:histidine kinase n=1 Tax=Solirubrobacter ginsenosidimutans TaxID=490573 RepID=A0A9X3MTV6_9ACTN|nr:ATP-binding protein [Solirubrobacter ginsenosidimutans]MDA0161347.1 ATP-binding protein [Solirubrobacter ginsenosidimutans]
MKQALFVDDDPSVLESLRDALRPWRRGWRATFACGGDTAVDINESIRTTLIVAANQYKYVADIKTELGPVPAIVCSVGDSGCGIPPELAGWVFDPFFTTKDVGRGTGQGLAIARAIVVGRHAGVLSFAPRPGGGTTFTIRLPLTNASNPAVFP